MIDMKPGSRWRSAVSDVEVVIIRPPSGQGALACGGAPMVASATPRGEAAPDQPAGVSLVGKRYEDAATGLEALCAKGGAGELSFDGRRLVVKEARKLPSSD